jgi:hypothetical protein
MGLSMEEFTISDLAQAVVLGLGALGSLLLVVWQSRCLCRCRIGLGDRCYLFDCERAPPPIQEEEDDDKKDDDKQSNNKNKDKKKNNDKKKNDDKKNDDKNRDKNETESEEELVVKLANDVP